MEIMVSKGELFRGDGGTGGGGRLHQLLLGALRTQDVGAVCDEALAHQGAFAHGTDEAVVVPVPVLEGDEAGATNACDGLGAGGASLGEELPEAVCAVGLVIPGGEALAGEGGAAVGAGEALPMPGLVLVGHTARGDDLVALDASCSELVLVAGGAVDLLVPRDEAFGSDGRLAHAAAEAFLVPLPGLVFHLLVACPEDLSAAVTARGELGVIARAAEYLVHLGSKLFVHEGHLALVAQETFLMPVLVLVRQILGVDADRGVAVLAGVREDGLVALDAVGMVILQDVALPSEGLVALPAAEVARMPVLGHGFGVLPAENEVAYKRLGPSSILQ